MPPQVTGLEPTGLEVSGRWRMVPAIPPAESSMADLETVIA